MQVPEDSESAVRRFFQALFYLREQLTAAEFEAVCTWLKMLAEESPVAH